MNNHCPQIAHARERGAVLFMSLMILIVLTLLGLSAAQVTTLQERMASIYRADEMASQNAEAALAEREREMTQISSANNVLCENYYNGSKHVAEWRKGNDLTTLNTVENLAQGATFINTVGSLEAGLGRELGDKNCLFLQISTHAYDDPAAKSVHAVVQSIFTP